MFKVGDRVECSGGYRFDPLIGTVVWTDGSLFRVKGDQMPEDVNKDEWHYYASEMSPIESKRFAIGDRVHHNDPMFFASSPGWGVVVGVDDSGYDIQADATGNTLYFYNDEVSAPADTSDNFSDLEPSRRSMYPYELKVLDHLATRGSISPAEAMMTYGIMRLAAAVHGLRALGISVKTEMKADAVGHRYARYSLN